jgi:hypothetical protein
MLSRPNETVLPNQDLMAEILEAQQQRAFERARKLDPSIQSFEQFREVHYPESINHRSTIDEKMLTGKKPSMDHS